ncbi:zymogen granule membrane protein 16-like isoform X1 [Hippocampus comes]|nr:PREDICTED: zymogen granule membrane protein 16-like isoform X1 [Hippocampus comes]XP_019729232.1 PREDICTED: zymogen granule membrane protein 16-like isoform X1 [Hippocampus comes]
MVAPFLKVSSSQRENHQTSDRMILLLFIALLSRTALADGHHDSEEYSFSPHVGSGQGISYALTGSGRITGVRLWEASNNFVYGIQLRYDYTWTDIAGRELGIMQEIELFHDEFIVQISGKYTHNIQSLVITTNLGRSLYAGRPTGHSFNMYPDNEKGELRLISGRFHGAITSLGAHWGVRPEPDYGSHYGKYY